MDENLEQKYELIVDNLLDIIVELDLYGNFIFVSPQSIDITGYHRDELIGTSLYKCVHPNDLSILKNAIEDAKIDRKHISLEFRIKHKNGNYIYLSAKGRLVDIDSKQKIIVMARDFSRKKLTEQKLKESEELLNDIIDQTFIGFAIFQDFEIKFFNLEFSKVIGYTYEEIMNWKPKEFFKIIHPQDREKFISLAQRVYLGDNVALNSFQFRILKKSGDNIWFEIQTKPINYKGNKADLVFLQDITSHKEAEQKLKESEEQYRNLISNLTDILLIINLKGVVIYVSPQCYDIMGYQPNELIGKNCFNYIYSEDWLKITEAIKNAFKTKDIISVEYGLLHKNGNKITVSGNGRYINFNGNDGFIVTIRDVTGHKEIEDKLKESEEKFRTIAEQSFMGITIFLDNAISYANQAILDIFGYSLDEVISWKPLEYLKLFPPKDREFITGQLREQQNGYDPSIHNYQVQFIKKNGESGWLDLFSTPIKYKGKLGAIVSVIDITERKIAEQKLRESEERLKILYKYAPDAYYLNDMNGNFVDGNDAAERLIGYKKEQLIGKNFSRILPENQISLAVDLLSNNKNGINTGPSELSLKHKDGREIPVEIRTHPIKINDKHLVLGIARDITERKIAEQKLKESEEKYRHLFEKSPFSIILFDSEGIIKDCNSASEGLFGFKKEELLGYNYFHNPTINPDHLPITKKRYEQLKEGESLLPQELKIIRADGTFIWINTQISKVKISNQTYFYSIIQDITTKKTLEDIMFELNQNFFNYTSDFQENIQSLAQTAKKLSKGTLVLYAKKVFHEDGSTIQIITSENEVINFDFTDFKKKYFIIEILEL